jgi:hypothetical protein
MEAILIFRDKDSRFFRLKHKESLGLRQKAGSLGVWADFIAFRSGLWY